VSGIITVLGGKGAVHEKNNPNSNMRKYIAGKYLD
jgi:hypothetical protein